MRLIIDAISDKGSIPHANEDMVLVGNDCLRDAAKSYAFDFDTYDYSFLIALADGLGGHTKGAYASEAVLKKMQLSIAMLPPGLRANDLKKYLGNVVSLINEYIRAESDKDSSQLGMASTFSGVLFYENHFFLLHIGDSRVYRYGKGKLTRLSRDHSPEELKVNNGKLKNVLLNAFGTEKEIFFDFEDITQKLHDDDIILLCTDGLTNQLPDDSIEKYIALPDAHLLLAKEANNQGGHDNISMAVVRYVKY
ncbi:PP2C family protein-serine/threonine phosphatase [Parasediminibacterium sp. JCM 36343]|uniref:PP2C family protein-serine/threonine phosphatase n=1 Tax=Parasediminibacterium sp. JCM 36343 TaxID=3374279 RepID=UPI00397B6D86